MNNRALHLYGVFRKKLSERAPEKELEKIAKEIAELDESGEYCFCIMKLWKNLPELEKTLIEKDKSGFLCFLLISLKKTHVFFYNEVVEKAIQWREKWTQQT